MKRVNSKVLYMLFVFFALLVSCSSSDDPDPVIEKLGKPIGAEADQTTYTSFRANWSRVYRAESYQLDISENQNFSSFISEYNSKSISRLYENVIGLEQGTTYYYRVRAVKGTEISENSNVITTTTLEEEKPEPDTPLKEKATFFVGVAVKSFNLTNLYDEVINREFNSVTAEYEMKMNVIMPDEGQYDWSKSDAIVNYAIDNNLNVHGHALIWHQSTPDWIENYVGTDEEFEQVIKDYITAVVSRYKGQVKSWDVVNEAVSDGTGILRNSVFRQRMGDDYIEKCFQFARDADPDALLFYNDYNMCEDETKRNAVLTIVDDFITRGVPINGIGYQLHVRYNGPDKNTIQEATDELVLRDLLVHFSEIDIRVNPNNDISELTEDRAIAQKVKMKEIVQVFNAIPDENKYAITIWGIKDNESWILNMYDHSDWPLLFDSNFGIKKAHTGFLEGLD